MFLFTVALFCVTINVIFHQGEQMKKLFSCILILIILLGCLVACQMPEHHDDEIMYMTYYYRNEYNSSTMTGIDWKEHDLGILVDLANDLVFTETKPQFFKTKVQYCVRHYNNANDKNNSFFENGNEEYKALNGDFTNDYADVVYTLDMTYGHVKQEYTTAQGTVTQYATLTDTQLTSVKQAFATITDAIEPKEGRFSLSAFELWIEEINVDDIAMVKFITDTSTINDFRYIYSTTDRAMLQAMFVRCQQMEMFTVDVTQTQVTGGSATTVEFVLTDGTVKSFDYYSNQYYTDGTRYFKFQSDFDEHELDLTYGFTPATTTTAQVYAVGDTTAICEVSINDIEFVRVTDITVVDGLTPTHYIKTEFGDLCFISNEYFYIDGDFFVEGDTEVYYKLVGKNFNQLVGFMLKFDLETCITDLENNGFVLEINSNNLSMSITINGEKLKIVGQRMLELSADGSKYVLIYIMESPEAAQQFVAYTLENRKENPTPTEVKITYDGRYVICCNYEPAMEIIGLKFEN